MNRRPCYLLLAVLASFVMLGFAAVQRSTVACPFCGGVQQSLSDEIGTAESSVIAKLVGKVEKSGDKKPKAKEGGIPVPPEILKTRFEIVDVLKGGESLGETRAIEVLYFGDAKPGTPFLIHATNIDGLAWGTPVPLTDRSVSYVRQLADLPKSGGERLAFFRQHLEDEDELMGRDSFDEFAKAPYADVKAVKEHLDHDQLVKWIRDEGILTSHRRLYLLMLGVIGRDNPQADDLAMLEETINADPETLKPALDATIGCYLTLKGADGMPLIEDRFLKNKDCPYSDTYSAIMALRFHGQEEQIIPRERVLQGLRYLLDRPELADLIIPDLARWQDWSAMDRLVDLFKNANEKSSWVRVPVIQYLKACPLPKAEGILKELAKIDPDAVRRANFFVPLGGTAPKPVPPAAKDKESAAEEPAAEKSADDADDGAAAVAPNDKSEKAKPDKNTPPTAEPKAGKKRSKERASAVPATTGTARAPLARSKTVVVGVPLVGGPLLFGTMVLILRGGHHADPSLLSAKSA